MQTSTDGIIEESIQHLAELHRHHEDAATPIQKAANQITRLVSRPGVVAIILLLMLAWIIGNSVAKRLGVSALETFPFPDLAFLATISAFLVALLILTTQRHEDELAKKRSQLTLQIAVLSEKKIAKIIQLLEEQRRDNPMLSSRFDPEAAEMAIASDPRASLQQIEAIRQED